MPASHPVTKEGNCGAFFTELSVTYAQCQLRYSRSVSSQKPPSSGSQNGQQVKAHLLRSRPPLLQLEAAGPLLSLNTTLSTIGLSPVTGTERNTVEQEEFAVADFSSPGLETRPPSLNAIFLCFIYTLSIHGLQVTYILFLIILNTKGIFVMWNFQPRYHSHTKRFKSILDFRFTKQ